MAGLKEKTRHPGIYKAHARGCPGSPCRCAERFQATVYLSRERKLIRKHFDGIKAAQAWRRDMGAAAAAGTVRPPVKLRVDEAAERLLAGMRDGSIATRSGETYRPATIRRYEVGLRRYVLPKLGALKVTDVHRRDVQALIESMRKAGLKGSTIQNSLDPLRVIFRRALRDDIVATDPMAHLDIPPARPEARHVESRHEAARLLAALPQEERALWDVRAVRRTQARRTARAEVERRRSRRRATDDPRQPHVG